MDYLVQNEPVSPSGRLVYLLRFTSGQGVLFLSRVLHNQYWPFANSRLYRWRCTTSEDEPAALSSLQGSPGG
jgi:hypothetical protein